MLASSRIHGLIVMFRLGPVALLLIVLAFALAATIVYAQLGDNQAAGGTINAAVSDQIPPEFCGDLNGDGTVNVFDAIVELQIIVGLVVPSAEQLRLGDVVRDGTINVFDAILVLQHIVGLTEITACGPLA